MLKSNKYFFFLLNSNIHSLFVAKRMEAEEEKMNVHACTFVFGLKCFKEVWVDASNSQNLTSGLIISYFLCFVKVCSSPPNYSSAYLPTSFPQAPTYTDSHTHFSLFLCAIQVVSQGIVLLHEWNNIEEEMFKALPVKLWSSHPGII